MSDTIQKLLNKDQELSEHFEMLERKYHVLEIRMETLREMKNEVIEEMNETLDARKRIISLIDELHAIISGE